MSRSEFESLFNETYSDLCAYAKLILNDLDAAEEIVQDLFVKFWEHRDEIEIAASLRSYLFKSARNACLNLIKHRAVEEVYKHHNKEMLDSGTVGVDDELEVSEMEIEIRTAIDKLPPERKKIFIMCRFEGMKYKEIADINGISVKTVENQMGKAMKFLKEELSDYFPLFMLFLLNPFIEN